MNEWYVGRQANWSSNWPAIYGQLLQNIDANDSDSAVRTIRRWMPRGSNGNDHYLFLGIEANSSSEARDLGQAIFHHGQH